MARLQPLDSLRDLIAGGAEPGRLAVSACSSRMPTSSSAADSAERGTLAWEPAGGLSRAVQNGQSGAIWIRSIASLGQCPVVALEAVVGPVVIERPHVADHGVPDEP